MDLEVEDDRDNQLLGRKELRFTVEHPGESTVRRADVRKKLAALNDADEDLVLVNRMNTDFGRPVTRGEAHIYRSPERMEQVEPGYIVSRNLAGEVTEEAGDSEPEVPEEGAEGGEPE